MNKLLGNLNAIESGEYKSTAKTESNEMKKILESFSAVQECGDMPMQQSMPQEQGNPVTMNVSVTASGKEHVDDLLALMKMAGVEGASTMPVPSEPKQDMDMAQMRAMMSMDDDVDMDEDERYQASTSPDEEYKDDDFMIKDLSGGLNRQKKAYKAAQDGDNAMAVETIKARLLRALEEKKKPDENNNGIPDYAEDGKGPNDLKKKKKK